MAVWFKDGSSGDLKYTSIKYGGFGQGIFKNECLIIDLNSNVVSDQVQEEYCSPYE